ncbi:MAG: YfhL family 4Fe-4S dicluster ferredoxin [Deltaproteobacteria bacterium]|nr:YfhL family 4Fe-4S dicluster ferredoxin [Deltaproteobacteria bacterium]MBW2414904.1 YfhL family 4Fe-4S dicluster ferredoxin [Deltaproteobacteria bacterium]
MANMITEQCFNCGVCERVCPAAAITRGEQTFVVDPGLCGECVGFYHSKQCERVCPIDCCVPDPNNVEDEATLFERVQKAHPEIAHTLELGPETSHFQAHNRTLSSSLKRVGRRIGRALTGPDSGS